MLDEVWSIKFAIHLFAEDVLQSIHPLFDCWSGTCEVPILCYSCNPAFYDLFDYQEWGTKCWISDPKCAILPSIILLIAKNKARNAKSGLAILFLCSFSYILLNFSAFPISFLPIASSIYKHNFLFYFLYIILPVDTTKSIPYFSFLPFLNPFLHSCYKEMDTLGYYYTDYFWVLPHRLLLGTTTDLVFC